MTSQTLVHTWFSLWETGEFENLPLSESFKHTSPYGIINGREAYMQLVLANRDQFLGNKFLLREEMYDHQKACIRYTMVSEKFSMEVSEWFYIKNNLIDEVISYYNIEGEISEDRQLSEL